MAPILECRDFSFSIGKNRILEDISFRLDKGEWLSIIGPNGSGKSTLLKNLLRLVEGARAGEIRVHDRPIETYSQKDLARRLAYVPQAGGGAPPFTVSEFVNLSRYPFGFGPGRKEQSEIVDRALELTDTARLAQRRMDTLSGGQRQRAFLAAALAQDTDTLLLDEPASFLDPRHVYAMNELLKRLHEERGLTIVTVTHDLSHPLDAGGRALVLKDGRQLHYGPVGDLMGHGILEEAFAHKFNYLVHPRTGKPLVVA